MNACTFIYLYVIYNHLNMWIYGVKCSLAVPSVSPEQSHDDLREGKFLGSQCGGV